MIRLLVGLGNPGVEYEGTRHNAGFWWLEAAARQLGASLQMQGSWFGLAGRVNRPEAAGGALWLLQPMTYMNNSGKAVAALARFYKIAPAEILVAHDELDLQPGQVKIKCGGSPGGNGIRDVAAQLGASDFWRLRLGIGHPGVKAEVINYVLRKPPAEQREAIDKIIAATVAELPLLLAGEVERAMGKVNAKPPRPKPPRPAPAPAEPPAADGGQKP